MNKEQRRAVVECLMCASDNKSPPLFELEIDGEFSKLIVGTAIRLRQRTRRTDDDYNEVYTLTTLEAAYRKIERDPKLRAEWFARPEPTDEDLVAMVVSAPPIPLPDGWQAKVHAECDKLDEQTRHDVAASVARHFEMDESHKHEPVVFAPAIGNTDDEPTHVGAVVVDALFDQTESE
jgi:hypothetical protein